MKASADPLELEPVLDALPVGFDALRAEALAEGFRQVERLASDWEAGTTRFDRDGEALLAAPACEILGDQIGSGFAHRSVFRHPRASSCQEILWTGQFVVPAKAGTQGQVTEIPGFPLSRERRI